MKGLVENYSEFETFSMQGKTLVLGKIEPCLLRLFTSW